MKGIYLITNIVNNKKYVGQSINIQQRWKQHIYYLNNNKHSNRHLQGAWNKYGESNFTFSILESCDQQDAAFLNAREKFWIQEFDSYNNGYNLDLGGQGSSGYKHTEEELQKMRQIQHPKPIVQLDENFNLIREWDSCSQASKALHLFVLGIKKCCRHEDHQKTIGGYYWLYKEEFEDPSFDPSIIKVCQFPKKVDLYDNKMNYIRTYDSIRQASIDLKVNATDITHVCNKTRKTAKGYIFRRAGSPINIEEELNFLNSKKVYIKNTNPILQYSLNGELIAEFSNSLELEEKTGFSRANIFACCNGHQKSSGGYVWKFKNKS